MSVELYKVRVYHDGSRAGVVRIGGVHRHCTGVPEIEGLPDIEAIDYAPETGTFLLKPLYEGLREMKHEERDAVARWLERVEKGHA